MADQRHILADRHCIGNQPEVDTLAKASTQHAKKLQVGLHSEDEVLTGKRICALLNLGLSDMSEPILNRIMASRNRAIELQKDRFK